MNKRKLLLSLGTIPLLLNCTKNVDIKVYFYAHNATPDLEVSIKANSKLTAPSKPTKKNCTFDGWFEGEDPWSFELNTFSKDTILNARYKINRDDFVKSEENPEARHNKGNLRIMSFNVLTEKYNNMPAHFGTDEFNVPRYLEYRDRDMLDTVEEYQPDVIGFQELDYVAYKYINEHSTNYELINKDYIVDPENPRVETRTEGKKDDPYFNAIFSTLAYNKNKVRKLGDYQILYHGKNADNHDCRYLTLQAFEQIKTNKKFIVTSTHWNLSSLTAKEKKEGMSLLDKANKNLKQAQESAKWTLKFQEINNGIPVITTGDYNARDFRETYKEFLKLTDFQDSKYTAKEIGLACDTSHIGHGEESTETSKWDRGITSVYSKHMNTCYSIDHIFASKNITPVYYDTISTTKALNCSDHMPIYADFII